MDNTILSGMLIGAVTTVRNRDIAYGLVLVWAYVGILIKHKSAIGFSGQYPEVISTVIVCIVFLMVAVINIILKRYILESLKKGSVKRKITRYRAMSRRK